MGGSASKHHVIEGSVAPGYESVKKIFEDNFDRGAEENSQGSHKIIHFALLNLFRQIKLQYFKNGLKTELITILSF